MIIQWIKQSKNWTYSHSKSKISIQKKLQSMSVFSQLGYIFFSILFWSHPRFCLKNLHKYPLSQNPICSAISSRVISKV